MSVRLLSERVSGGVLFSLAEGEGVLALSEWALSESARLGDDAPARIGTLIRLAEDERAIPRESALFVPDLAVAQLDEAERRGIGLPGDSEVELELRGSGAFADPDFALELRYLHPGGSPVVAPVRDGCFLEIGTERRVLPDPLYSLCEAVDRYNREPPRTTEQRMLGWAPIAAALPDGVELEDPLDSVRIVWAGAFSLRPFRNESGEPDFDPVLGRFVEQDRGVETERVFEEVLPEARHEDFARRFRGFSTARRRYLAGDGYYVFLSEGVERALHVVREAQQGDAGVRRRFLTRPSAFLRDALEPVDEGAEPVLEEMPSVDDVFFDEGLSDRVKGIGIREPKVLPWLQPSGEVWLPEDPGGLLVDGEPVPVAPEQAEELLEAVRKARREGRSTVSFGGSEIPANEETEAAVQELIDRFRKRGRSGGEDEGEGEGEGGSEDGDERTTADDSGAGPEEETGPGAKLSLLVIDNLDQLGFRMERRGNRASVERLPTRLETRLLPHQEAGLRWLQEHWVSGSPGALLADDMGLGKTFEALAFCGWLEEEMEAGRWPRRPILVVAPTGLLLNWQAEHDERMAGDGLGTRGDAYGVGLRRLRSARDHDGGELATGLPSLDISALARFDWVLTTYETLRDYQHSFARVHWGAIVFDEAQKIKNPKAGMTDAAKGMRQDFVLAMTGTPVENRVEDLWSILDVARPGGLGSAKDFSARFSVDDPAQKHEAFAALRKELVDVSDPAIMLRRLKEDYIEGLPEKTIHVHRLPMPIPQAEAYRDAVLEAHDGSPIIVVLQRLRNISLHPSIDQTAPDAGFIEASARVSLAFRVLDDVAGRDEKALVFVDSLAMQAALAEILQRRYRLREPILIINGEVANAKRKARVDAFQTREGFDVMLLSPKAGGVGLTLTAASHAIHLSRWWNPAVEDQCTDRIHRIGQEKPVHVHHVLSEHPVYGERSFDLRLASLLDRKRLQNRSILAPSGVTDADWEQLYEETVGEGGVGES